MLKKVCTGLMIAFLIVFAQTIQHFISAQVSFTLEPSNTGMVPFEVMFYGPESELGQDCGPDTFAWDFGDGTSGSGSPINHTFQFPGVFTVTLTYTTQFLSELEECISEEFTAVDTITVTPPPCFDAPEAQISSVSPGTEVTEGTPIFVEGQAANPSGCETLNTRWRLTAPSGSGAALSSATGSSSSFLADTAGRYVVSFIADNEFSVGTDNVTITATEIGSSSTPDDNGGSEGNGVTLTPSSPAITSVDPSSGAPGFVVVIRGSNFSLNFNENLVFFGSVQAQVLSATANALTVVVPNLSNGTYSVSVSVVSADRVLTGIPPHEGALIEDANSSAISATPLLQDSQGSNIFLFEVVNGSTISLLSGVDILEGFVIGEVIIFFEPGVSDREILNLQNEFNIETLIAYPTLGFYRGILRQKTVAATLDVIDRLNRDPRVDEAFFNELIDILQDDPALADQDWLFQLGLPEGFDTFFPKRGEGVIIAVIDTGADLSLPNLQNPELTFPSESPDGLNFSPKTDDPTGDDELGHGTAVSTIAAASIENGFNGAGVAPKARVLPMKIFTIIDGQVKATNEGVAQALMAAFSLGADVVNMSLGCHGCDEKKEKALRNFYSKTINNLLKSQQKSGNQIPIIVAASGNDGEGLIDAPAFHDSVIAVGSITPDLAGRSAFSNFGPELDFVAVGETDVTTLIEGNFGDPGEGTSFAAPQMSGLIALILAERPGLTFKEIYDLLQSCFIQDVGAAGFDEETGWGRIFIPLPLDSRPECFPS